MIQHVLNRWILPCPLPGAGDSFPPPAQIFDVKGRAERDGGPWALAVSSQKSNRHKKTHFVVFLVLDEARSHNEMPAVGDPPPRAVLRVEVGIVAE